jgi:predicted phage-related endonuclease
MAIVMTAVAERDWRTWRSRGVGASEVAGVLGTSGNVEAMRWGQLLEHAILTECERRLGIAVAGEQTWCSHRIRPWAIATVDAFYADRPDFAVADAAGVVEVKTTSDPRWYEVPDYYQVQVQWQLEVCDLEDAWLACLHNGRRLSLWPIHRDRELGADLLMIVEAFWVRHVLGGEPPSIDGRAATTAAIGRRFAHSEPEMIADLSGMADEIARLREVREQAKALEDERTLIENRIKEALGPAEAGDVDGTRAVTWKSATSKRVDIERLRDEQPELAREFTTETTTRRFLLKPGATS